VLLNGQVALEEDLDHIIGEEWEVELATSRPFIILINSSRRIVLNNLLHQRLVDIIDGEVILFFSFDQEMAQSLEEGVDEVNMR